MSKSVEQIMRFYNGWQYVADGFRMRFPEWVRGYDGDYELIQECATFVDGRWEPFISHLGYRGLILQEAEK